MTQYRILIEFKYCSQDVEKDQVSNHMVHEHGYRKTMFKCQICTSTFDLKNELTEHKLSCRIEPKRKKRKSVQQILKDLDFKIDPDLDESDIMVSCPICLLELPKTDIRDHIVEIHSNPYSILTCGLCNRNFKSKITLRDHIKLVHEVGTSAVPCEVCGQVFRSKKYLSNHRRNVHGDKEFKCESCGKIFKSHLSLHQHSKYVHPPESATAPCPHCSKVFKSKTNLHQHVKIMHLGKRKSRGGDGHHNQTI